jgi:hypothetical protein
MIATCLVGLSFVVSPLLSADTEPIQRTESAAPAVQRVQEQPGTSSSGDFFDARRTYEEHIVFLHGLADAHPDLASLVVLGQSVQGRDLLAIRITGVGNGDDKPSLIYHAAQNGGIDRHGPAILAFAARHLLEAYGKDPMVTRLVDEIDWYLLPLMNPDGYESGDIRNANRVILSRNWGGPGGGPNAWSEPETAAMRDFFLSHPNTRAHLNLGWGSPSRIFFPWAYLEEDTPDHWTFSWMGGAMAVAAEEYRGTQYGVSQYGKLSPPQRGVAVDYSYGVHGTWALGVGVDAPFQEFRPVCEELLPSLLLFASLAVDCNENSVWDDIDIRSGTSKDINDNRMPDECERHGDWNLDGIIDLADYQAWGSFAWCMRGPDQEWFGPWCAAFDFDLDEDVDLADLQGFQAAFGGE